MKRSVLAALLFLCFVPTVQSAPPYKAVDSVETSFETTFGTKSIRTWSDDGLTLRSLVGPTTPIPNASISPTQLLDSLKPYLRIPVEQLSLQRKATSPGSVHYEFAQLVDGHLVENAAVYTDVSRNDEIIGLANLTVPLTLPQALPALSSDQARCFAVADLLRVAANCDSTPPLFPPTPKPVFTEARLTYFAVPPNVRVSYAVDLRSSVPYAVVRYVIDGTHGTVLERRNRVFYASGTGKVFDPNPFTNSAVTRFDNVPDQDPPYKIVTLRDLKTPASGDFSLSGTYVNVTDFELPATPLVAGPNAQFLFTRGSAAFASTMAYYHITEMQHYVQDDLKITDMVNRPIDTDIRAFVDDDFNSAFTYDPAGGGALRFGYRDDPGQVYQAEDGDVIAHEYGHALQCSKAADFYGSGAEARAMSEGFADYWAMTYFADRKKTALRPACYAQWIECSTGTSGCSRDIKLDSTFTDFDQYGEEHDNGAVWTAALWAIRTQLGNVAADRIILTSHISVPRSPTFVQGARAILTADLALNPGPGTHFGTLCQIFMDKLILQPGECAPLPPPP